MTYSSEKNSEKRKRISGRLLFVNITKYLFAHTTNCEITRNFGHRITSISHIKRARTTPFSVSFFCFFTKTDNNNKFVDLVLLMIAIDRNTHFVKKHEDSQHFYKSIPFTSMLHVRFVL